MTKDMTTGSPFKILFNFFVPLMLANLFQQFYNLADTIIVGRCIDGDALAAVGSTGSMGYLIIGFCTGVCSGFAIPIAKSFGAKNYSDMRKYTANCIYVAVIMTVVFTAGALLSCRKLLEIMNTNESIFEDANAYLFVIFLGIPATILYNLCAAIIRALGDSKMPLIFLIISSVANIFLDLFCIETLGLGVRGAAIATISSQALSGIMCLIYLSRFEIMKITKEERAFSAGHIKTLCYTGFPMGFQCSLISLGSVIQQTAVNNLVQPLYITAVTAASKIYFILGGPFDSIGVALATFTSQNLGAGKLDRIKTALKECLIIGLVISIISALIIFLFGKNMAYIFVETPSEELISYVYEYLVWCAVFFISLSWLHIFKNLIQGLGYSNIALLGGFGEMLARIISAFYIIPIFGYVGLCASNVLSWILADLFLIPAFFIIVKKVTKSLTGNIKQVNVDN